MCQTNYRVLLPPPLTIPFHCVLATDSLFFLKPKGAPDAPSCFSLLFRRKTVLLHSSLVPFLPPPFPWDFQFSRRITAFGVTFPPLSIRSFSPFSALHSWTGLLLLPGYVPAFYLCCAFPGILALLSFPPMLAAAYDSLTGGTMCIFFFLTARSSTLWSQYLKITTNSFFLRVSAPALPGLASARRHR